MKTTEAIAYFGSKRDLWEALELKGQRGTIQNWKGKPPMAVQYELELITNGHLRADGYESRRIYDPPPGFELRR